LCDSNRFELFASSGQTTPEPPAGSINFAHPPTTSDPTVNPTKTSEDTGQNPQTIATLNNPTPDTNDSRTVSPNQKISTSLNHLCSSVSITSALNTKSSNAGSQNSTTLTKPRKPPPVGAVIGLVALWVGWPRCMAGTGSFTAHNFTP
jgi:hypothetical protein